MLHFVLHSCSNRVLFSCFSLSSEQNPDNQDIEKSALLSRLWQQCGFSVFSVLVESRGIEPLSENPSSQLSPSAVYLLRFPPANADKQAFAIGSL